MVVCLFWVVMLALDIWEHGNRAAHKSLLVWAITSTMLYLGHCAFFNEDRDILPFFDTLYVMSNLAVFPLFLHYIVRLTEGRASLLLNVLVIAPPIVLGGIVGVLYMLMNPIENNQFIENYLYHNSFDGLTQLALWQAVVHQIGRLLFAIGVVVTLWIGVSKVRRYNRFIDSVYSDTEDKHLYGIATILWVMVVTCLASFVLNAIGRHFFVGRTGLLVVPFVTFSILLFVIGYVGYKQRFSFDDVICAGDDDESIADKEMEAEGCVEHGNLYDSIRTMMAEEELFLIPNLKVDNVAQKLCTNRRYVQQAINEEMGMTFSEYINGLRIDYAEQLLLSQPELTIKELGVLSGYTTMSTFYRNFKKYKGRQPKTEKEI